MSNIPNLTGQQLDSYRLLRLLGGGTFGDVYEATDLRNRKHVAIKVLNQIESSKEHDQFFREVRALVRLRHAHIVLIIDFGIDEQLKYPFIVMQYAPKSSLYQKHKRGEQLPLTTVVQYIKQLADTLQYAHDDHFIHCDVKPANVLLDDNEQLLLSDFGLITSTSSLRSYLTQTNAQEVGGTPLYMAPEQIKGQPEKASDQYALAIMAYEWLCGYPPFYQGNVINIQYQHIHEPVPPLHAKRPDLSPQIEAVILKALSKRPDERYPTIQAFAQELEMASSKPPIGTRLLIYQGRGKGYSSSIAWSPDGKLFATSVVGGLIQFWDAKTGILVSTYGRRSIGYSDAMAWSSDGTHIALTLTFDEGNVVAKVWETRNGELIHTCASFYPAVTAVAWSLDGTRLAAASAHGILQVWEANSEKMLEIYRGHNHIVNTVAWSPDGTRLASVSNDKTVQVQVWEASSGKLLPHFTHHPSFANAVVVNAMAWSPDGTRLAFGSLDRTVQVREANSGKLLLRYAEHISSVNAVAWSPDSTRLASASLDGMVQVWEASSGKLLFRYTGHTSFVNAVAWSPDGTRLASASLDGTIQIWQAV